MHLEYTPEQQRLRAELREYFAALVPDDAYTRFRGPDGPPDGDGPDRKSVV